MVSRLAIFLAIFVSFLGAAVPTPKEHLGYEPGTNYKLADYNDIYTYFQKLAAESDRIKVVEFGKTSTGKPMIVAFISDAANLRKLDQYREMNRKLALGEASAEEARRLATESKAFVWIDSGLHATEVAPAQQSFLLAHRMVTAEDDETKRIRRDVILMQVPCINPDGLDLVSHWYRQNVGTPYELAPVPFLYQKYAGHDNNRDWFMLNLTETRNVSRLLFREWFPQIVYNQHQQPAFPARIFVPPYAEPLNPNIPATTMEGINLIGAAMKERFARENKPGILSYWGFDAWWNGGLRSAPAFHNMHGILTETAGFAYATPHEYKLSDFPQRFGNGIPTKEPSVFYQRPWMGGVWTIRDAMDYMVTADFAILDLASTRREHFLFKAWETARANIDAGRKSKPYAYILPPTQADRWSSFEMLRRLNGAGIQVERARREFKANGKTYPQGTMLIRTAQPFRPYLIDLMEPQKYPELRAGESGPTKRPYDIAGWTLPMQMGVEVDRTEESFDAELEAVAEIASPAPVLDHRDNSSFLATADLLRKGVAVGWAADGSIVTGTLDKAKWELKAPRVAIYEPHSPNIDQGWTEWVLDIFEVPHTVVKNADIEKGDLNQRFDTLILAQQTAESILFGNRENPMERPSATRPRAVVRPEHTGGIGVQGVAQIETFLKNGGTLIALSSASEVPLQFFPVPVRNTLRRTASDDDDEAPRSAFYSPGSLLRITVDNTNPIAFGMPAEAVAFSSGGQAFEVGEGAKSIARYSSAMNLLASGWVSGATSAGGRTVVAEASLGKGRVILYGIRPQHRGQTFGTFKLLLNAIYLGSAKTR